MYLDFTCKDIYPIHVIYMNCPEQQQKFTPGFLFTHYDLEVPREGPKGRALYRETEEAPQRTDVQSRRNQTPGRKGHSYQRNC